MTGDQLEVYHWKHLDVPAESRFAWRTDESISGVEECLVDAAGGPALTLNQHPGGFLARIKPHPSLLPLYAILPQLRRNDAIRATLDRPRSLAPVLSKEARTSRISNMLDALLRYVDKYS